MLDWIVIAILYVLILLFFRFVGGVASAGDAMRQWGAHASAKRIKTRSTSS